MFEGIKKICDGYKEQQEKKLEYFMNEFEAKKVEILNKIEKDNTFKYDGVWVWTKKSNNTEKELEKYKKNGFNIIEHSLKKAPINDGSGLEYEYWKILVLKIKLSDEEMDFLRNLSNGMEDIEYFAKKHPVGRLYFDMKEFKRQALIEREIDKLREKNQ